MTDVMTDMITILGMAIFVIFMACCLFVILLLVQQQIVKSKERWQMEQWEKEQARKVSKLRRVK